MHRSAWESVLKQCFSKSVISFVTFASVDIIATVFPKTYIFVILFCVDEKHPHGKQCWLPRCENLAHGTAVLTISGIISCMRSANGRRRYIITASLIGWVHTLNLDIQNKKLTNSASRKCHSFNGQSIKKNIVPTHNTETTLLQYEAFGLWFSAQGQ